LTPAAAVVMAGMEGSSIGVGVGIGIADGGSRRWLIVVNMMIFLPISDGTFVDADDPLLVQC
jgi:hypothetical protein